MGIRDKAQYLEETKGLIRNAIISKGIDVPEDSPFRSYAEKIGLIQTDKVEAEPVTFGPYATSLFDPATDIYNSHGTLPTIPSSPEVDYDFEIPSDWYDLEGILNADDKNYPAKMIVQYYNNDIDAVLYGADYYKLSDGYEVASTAQTDLLTHKWDESKDKRVGASGLGWRYVIYYFSDPKVATLQSRYQTIRENATAVITKGICWQNTTTSTSNSTAPQYQPFANRKHLRYVKTIDSDWSMCSNLSCWFYQATSLQGVDLDFNSGTTCAIAPSSFSYMFGYCSSLTKLKFQLPPILTNCYYMFEECPRLTHLLLDFTQCDVGYGSVGFSSMVNVCNKLQYATILLSDTKDYIRRPWIMLECPEPIKVSQIIWKNPYSYVPKTVVIEASNDGHNWTEMGTIQITSTTYNSEVQVDIDDSLEYKAWRFKATDLGDSNSYFGAQNIQLVAKHKVQQEDGTTAWTDWTQPQFTSAHQDGYHIVSSSSNANVWYAFSNNGRYDYWYSEHCPATVIVRDFSSLFSACNQLQLVNIEGGHELTQGVNCSNWQARYVVFSDTSKVTTFNSSFNGCSNLLGVIIPHQDLVVNWNNAFSSCSALTVAPQITFNANAIASSMFSESSLSSFDYLDISKLKNANYLFYQTKLSYFNATLPEATTVNGLFRNCTSLGQVNLIAPKATSAASIFESCTSLDEVNLELGPVENMAKSFYGSSIRRINMDTSHVTNMSEAFRNTTNLKAVPDLDYSQVTNIDYIFYGSALSYLIDNEFPSVTTAQYAFASCQNLIAVERLSLPECLNMSYCFSGSASLQRIIEQTWSKVTDMSYCFSGCSDIVEIDLSQFIAVDLTGVCQSCSSLKKAILPSPVSILDYAFQYCTSLREVNIDDPTSITTMHYAFDGCYELASIFALNIPLCTNLDHAFNNCIRLAVIDLVDLSSVTNMDYFLYNANFIKNIIVPELPVCNSMIRAFSSCRLLESITIGATPVVTDMSYVLNGSPRLKSVTLTDTSSVTDFSYAFASCPLLEEISIPDTSKTKDFSSMFDYDRALKSISELNALSGQQFTNVFRFCNSLLESPIKRITSSAKNTQAMFEECFSITDWTFLSDFNMINVSNCSYMFRNVRFKSISLNWKFGTSCDMNYMFDRNPNLESVTIDFNSRDAHGEHQYMFADCPKLQSINLINTEGFSRFERMFSRCVLKDIAIDLSNYDDYYKYFNYMFAECPNLESVSINFADRTYTNNNQAEYMFANCPKLTYINLMGVQNHSDWYHTFAGMTNESECTVNWNDSIILRPYFRNMFSNSIGAPLTHINLVGLTPTRADKAFDGSIYTYYSAEPDVQYPRIYMTLPMTVQLNGVEFVQREVDDSYQLPDVANFYSDSQFENKLNDGVVALDDTSGAVTTVSFDSVVTDTLACHFGKEGGRYMGVAQINLKAKAKAKRGRTQWIQPVFDYYNTWGQVTASNDSSYAAWHALDGLLGNSEDYGNTWESNSTSAWWQWLFKDTLYVSKIRIYGRAYSSTYYTSTVKVTDTDTGEVLLDTTSVPRVINGYVDLDFDEPKALNGIKIDVTGSDYVGLGEVQITAESDMYEYYPWDTPVGDGVEIVDLGRYNFRYGASSTLASLLDIDDSYQCRGAYTNCYQPVINVLPTIASCTAGDYLFSLEDSTSARAYAPLVINDLDFYGLSQKTSGRSNWFNRTNSSFPTPTPVVLNRPRNILTSTNLSMMDLTHDSLIQVLNALMSRLGLSAGTLTLGATNLAKLSDSEKAIALNKNWNLA